MYTCIPHASIYASLILRYNGRFGRYERYQYLTRIVNIKSIDIC